MSGDSQKYSNHNVSSVEPEALLQDAILGKECAWEKIVKLYSPRVYMLIFTNCRDHTLSEEITQETFLRILKSLVRYKEKGQFESWIFQIAMNCLRDEMRKRSRHSTFINHDIAIDQGGVLVSGQKVDPEMAQQLHRAVESLSNREQGIILMRHRVRMSFSQIAKAIGEPLGTVLAAHHRALRKIRVMLIEEGFELSDFLQSSVSSGVNQSGQKI